MKADWPCKLHLALLAVALAAPCAARAQRVAAQDAVPATAGSATLGDALEAFGRRTGFDIIFPETLVRGLRAGPVDMRATPYRQLEQLLKGTGLVARFTRPDAVILEPLHTASAPDMTLDRFEARAPFANRRSAYEWYGQRLLGDSLIALRTSTELMSGPYDLIVYLWVDAQGKVTQARVRGENGTAREAGIAEGLLGTLVLDIPPPPDMPQPVGLRIASH